MDEAYNTTSLLTELDDRKALISAKVISMVTLGMSSFIVGILPLKVAKWLKYSRKTPDGSLPKQPLIISLLLCFGGGVLLFTTFIHLQPEVRESMEHLYKEKLLPKFIQNNMNIHVADIIFCLGFFFVYLVEETVHFFLDKRSHEQEDEAVLHRTMSLRKCAKHPCDHEPVPIIPRVSLNNGSNGAAKSNDMETGSGSISTSTQGLLDSNNISTISSKSHHKSPLDAQVRMTGGPLTKNHQNIELHSDSHSLKETSNQMVVAKSFRGLLAVLALSFHAIFEGLAVGLESRINNVWYLFGAIATHKLVIAFCVGIELVSSRTRLPLFLVYLATFAIVTPLGIGLGIVLSEEASAAEGNFVAVMLQGMAGGTLLYVIFFEVLQRERSNTQSGFLQLLAIMVGFAVMFALQFFRKSFCNLLVFFFFFFLSEIQFALPVFSSCC